MSEPQPLTDVLLGAFLVEVELSIFAMAAAFAQRLLDAFVDAGLDRQRCDFDEVRILRDRMKHGIKNGMT